MKIINILNKMVAILLLPSWWAYEYFIGTEYEWICHITCSLFFGYAVPHIWWSFDQLDKTHEKNMLAIELLYNQFHVLDSKKWEEYRERIYK